MLYVVRHSSLRRVDRSFRGVLPNVVYLSKNLKPHKEEDPASRKCCAMEKNCQLISFFSVVSDYGINIYSELGSLTVQNVA